MAGPVSWTGSSFIATSTYYPMNNAIYAGSSIGGYSSYGTPNNPFDYKKQRQMEEKMRQEEMRFWTLGKLSNDRKQSIMKITKQLLSELRFERRWKNMTSGIKWFLIFLGLAIFLNFGKILSLVQLAIKH